MLQEVIDRIDNNLQEKSEGVKRSWKESRGVKKSQEELQGVRKSWEESIICNDLIG